VVDDSEAPIKKRSASDPNEASALASSDEVLVPLLQQPRDTSAVKRKKGKVGDSEPDYGTTVERLAKQHFTPILLQSNALHIAMRLVTKLWDIGKATAPFANESELKTMAIDYYETAKGTESSLSFSVFWNAPAESTEGGGKAFVFRAYRNKRISHMQQMVSTCYVVIT
jgi:hypothetical protein